MLASVEGAALPTGVALTADGGLSIAGLEWLGARVYDPAARGFLSTELMTALEPKESELVERQRKPRAQVTRNRVVAGGLTSSARRAE